MQQEEELNLNMLSRLQLSLCNRFGFQYVVQVLTGTTPGTSTGFKVGLLLLANSC